MQRQMMHNGRFELRSLAETVPNKREEEGRLYVREACYRSVNANATKMLANVSSVNATARHRLSLVTAEY